MAYSKGFFSKRRGSAGSLTFSVLNGKQITKEKVTTVTNPKSTGQSVQRLKMAPAQKFYDAFEALLNHSWQNVQYGNKSRNFFMSKALKRNGGPYVAKGVDTLVPGTYQISSGKLGDIRMSYNGEDAFISNIKLSGVYEPGFTTHDEFVADVLDNNSWINPGDKLTFVMIVKVEDAAGVHYVPTYIQTELTPNGKTWDTISASDAWFYIQGTNPNYDGQLGISNTMVTPLGSDPVICSCGIIVSSGTQKEDKRSTSFMAVDTEIINLFYSQQAYDYAVASYQGEDAVAVGDEWILNTLATGLFGRVVAQSATLIAQGRTYNVQYLMLEYELAGVRETRVFTQTVGANDFLVNTDGQILTIFINGQSVGVTINNLPDGSPEAIEWNDAYLPLFNGMSASASPIAPVTLKPMPAQKAAPDAISTAMGGKVTDLMVDEDGVLYAYYRGEDATTEELQTLSLLVTEDDRAYRVTTDENGYVLSIVQGNNPHNEVEAKISHLDYNIILEDVVVNSIVLTDFQNVKPCIKIVELCHAANIPMTEEQIAADKFEIGKCVANQNLTVLCCKDTTDGETPLGYIFYKEVDPQSSDPASITNILAYNFKADGTVETSTISGSELSTITTAMGVAELVPTPAALAEDKLAWFNIAMVAEFGE